MNTLEQGSPLEIKKWTKQVLGAEVVKQICQIAETSFPPEEREPCQTLIKTIQDGRSILYTASINNLVLGFTKLTPLAKSDLYLMEYLAVDVKSRNQGICRKILQFIRKDLKKMKARGLILEVEQPNESNGEERGIRQRRIQFYQRNGAQMVLDGNTYRMPNLAGEGSLPMHLMWLPIEKGARPPWNLTLPGLIALIFTETYEGEKNETLLRSILERLPDPNAPIELGESQ